MAKFEDLVGQKFGRLTVIGFAGKTQGGKPLWNCTCDCGEVKDKPTTSSDLKSGKVKSCGCAHIGATKGIRKKHGMAHTRMFQIWSSMKARCYNPHSVAYKNYGGRNIKVCDDWRNDFSAFYDWAIENGYSDKLTLDRINVNKGYCPENCKWSTMKEQQNNRRDNKIVIYKGEQFTLSQLADKLSISQATLGWRINNGWSERELSLPVSLNNKNIRSGKYAE